MVAWSWSTEAHATPCTQVFLLWQLLQLDEGEVNTCKLETESFLDELVALHRCVIGCPA